jgi:hypothetical protein
VNDVREPMRGLNRSGPVWVTVKVIASIVAAGLGFLFVGYWLSAVQFMHQDSGSDEGTGYYAFGFMLWFIPLLLATLAVLGAFGWRNLAVKIIIAIAAIITVSTLIFTIVSA